MGVRWAAAFLVALGGCGEQMHVASATSVGAAGPARGATASDGPGGEVGGDMAGDMAGPAPSCVSGQIGDATVGAAFAVGSDGLYWVVSSLHAPDNALWKMPKDGGAAAVVASTPSEHSGGKGLVADADGLFLLVTGSPDLDPGGPGWISRVAPDGSQTRIADGDEGCAPYLGDLADDGGSLLFVAHADPHCEDRTSYVLAAAKDGSGTRVLATAQAPRAPHADGGEVYFLDGTRLERVPEAGGAVETLAETGLGSPGLVAIAGGFAYVGDLLASQVVRIPLAGGVPVVVGSSASSGVQLTALAARGGRLYVGTSAGLVDEAGDGSEERWLSAARVAALGFDDAGLYAAGEGIYRFCN
ncbi:MAG TPA: hypothetical protein VN947_01045 [Polyangia bacterium]|nr:hypothetical protein [Polyangia bacterium]